MRAGFTFLFLAMFIATATASGGGPGGVEAPSLGLRLLDRVGSEAREAVDLQGLILEISVRNPGPEPIRLELGSGANGCFARSQGCLGLELIDAQGNRVHAPAWKSLHRPTVPRSAEPAMRRPGPVVELAPGEAWSRRVKLCEWSFLWGSLDLDSGRYRVRIGYDPARSAFIDGDPLLHDALWGRAFASEWRDLEVLEPEGDPGWGAPTRGLRLRTVVQPPPESLSPGAVLSRQVIVENVSEAAVCFDRDLLQPADDGFLIGPAGKIDLGSSAWASGVPVVLQWTLQPGQRLRLDTGSLHLGADPGPGRYHIHQSIHLRPRREGEYLRDPAPEDIRIVEGRFQAPAVSFELGER